MNSDFYPLFCFSSSHVWMWELDCEESWVPKNWCFWTVVLGEDSWESLGLQEIKLPVTRWINSGDLLYSKVMIIVNNIALQVAKRIDLKYSHHTLTHKHTNDLTSQKLRQLMCSLVWQWTSFQLPRWLNGKESACQAEDGCQIGVTGSIPGLGRFLEKEMATYSSILAWKIPWREKPDGLESMGSQRAGHDLVTKQQQPKIISQQRTDHCIVHCWKIMLYSLLLLSRIRCVRLCATP